VFCKGGRGPGKPHRERRGTVLTGHRGKRKNGPGVTVGKEAPEVGGRREEGVTEIGRRRASTESRACVSWGRRRIHRKMTARRRFSWGDDEQATREGDSILRDIDANGQFAAGGHSSQYR